MTTHTLHGDVLLSGLADDCPRCQEIARYPEVRADAELRARLLDGVLFTELDRRARTALLGPEPRGFDPPVSENERAGWAKAAPRCEKCGRESDRGHFPWCIRAPREEQRAYFDRQQREDYRRGVRELGCTCSDRLGPGTHAPGCPMFEGSSSEEGPARGPNEPKPDSRPSSVEDSPAGGPRREATTARAGAKSPSRGVPSEREGGDATGLAGDSNENASRRSPSRAGDREAQVEMTTAVQTPFDEITRRRLEYLDHLDVEHSEDDPGGKRL